VGIPSKTVLAPTCGILNLPMRMAFKKFGVGLTCIGVIDAQAVCRAEPVRVINLLGREETTCRQERPVSIQLIGRDAEILAEAARRVEPLASIIDLNFSGPLKSVLKLGFGAALLKDPTRIVSIVEAVVRRVSVPVTAKIRVGFNGQDIDIVEIAKACQGAGAAGITVHARSVQEGYSGPAHWQCIANVKRAVRIPVIGNGGIHSAADAKAMIDQTGCDFVMICSEAFVNPAIFLEIHALLATGTTARTSRTAGLLRFMREYYRQNRRLEARSPRRALKRAFPQFLAVRSFMKKLIAGEAPFGQDCSPPRRIDQARPCSEIP